MVIIGTDVLSLADSLVLDYPRVAANLGARGGQCDPGRIRCAAHTRLAGKAPEASLRLSTALAPALWSLID